MFHDVTLARALNLFRANVLSCGYALGHLSKHSGAAEFLSAEHRKGNGCGVVAIIENEGGALQKTPTLFEGIP